jgi:putative membrane protein
MIRKILLGMIINGVALYFATVFLDGIMFTGGLKFFIVGGIVIGLLNAFIKPIMTIMSLPFIFFTVGLFMLVINTIIFWLTVKLVNVISIQDVSVIVDNAWTYLWASLIFGFVNWSLHIIINNK